jgi:malonyl CoA-acyl carrier protein transacylase
MIYLFPTFPMRSPDFDITKIDGLSEMVGSAIKRAQNCVPLDLGLLENVNKKSGPLTPEQTEQAHYACMIENLAIADWASQNIGQCDRISSYSMGLFSAMIYAKALEFEATFELVHSICNLVHSQLGGEAWSVGAVIDFPKESLLNLISAQNTSLEITDYFGPHTILFTGPSKNVKEILDQALNDGAKMTRLIPLTAPFHTSRLESIQEQLDPLVRKLKIQKPMWPILSSLNQTWLLNADDIGNELHNNVTAPMNWFSTMQKIEALGTDTIVECGASIGLTDMARSMLPDSWTCLDFQSFTLNPAMK